MAKTLIQVRVDEELKNDVALLYENMGLDLSTAVRIFFKKSLAVGGIPFALKITEPTQSPISGLEALSLLRKEAEKNGLDTMTLEEINAEIKASRLEKK